MEKEISKFYLKKEIQPPKYMKKDAHKIPAASQKAIDDPTLMAYLKDDLSAAEKHVVEEAMLDDVFTDEAMEGLSSLKHRDIAAEVAQLKNNLQKQLQKKQARKTKRHQLDGRWTLIALILLFLTLLVSYLVLRMIA